MKNLRVIAFTHKSLDLSLIGKIVIEKEKQASFLNKLKTALNIEELFYLGTCNRVELVFTSKHELSEQTLKFIIQELSFDTLSQEEFDQIQNAAHIYNDEHALIHLIRVSSSLESLIVGEKEILAQVRQSYENARELGFTGDFLRICMNRVVKTAKEIYTNTKISEKPISVVSIAHRYLKEMDIKDNARILFIGAGETNQLFAKYLKKHKLNNFTIFNRSIEKAELLAKELDGKALPLSSINEYSEGFDVIITCTSAPQPILTSDVYTHLLQNEEDKKVIIDLAIPCDTHSDVLNNNVKYIDVAYIQSMIKKNMDDRYAELCHAEQIIESNVLEFRSIVRQRKVEIAMQDIPVKIKEIRQIAIDQVFADEINGLDSESKEVLDKVLNYMEKKYISIPMLMAKDILVKE